MTSLLQRIGAGALATVGVAALLTGCGAAPKSGGPAAAKSTFLPCVVGDVGGFNDHSFNQLSLEGVTKAAQDIGSTFKKVQSQSQSDYAPAFESLVSQKCQMIVAAGFQFPKPLAASATANPKVKYALIDDNTVKLPNVKDIVFETSEAAFLGGYAAAAYSKSGVVATWGGVKYPSVSIFMDGIVDGVAYYNKQKGKDVKVLGWNVEKQTGSFVGDFLSQNKAQTLTQGFLDQKADVIIPVAGGLYQGAAAAIRSSKSDAVLEGVDADLYQTDPKVASLVLTSIQKRVDNAGHDVVVAASKSKTFDNTTYVGDLKNGGVSLAPFHDYESKVPASLAGELKTVTAGIEDGSIKVESPSTFKK